MTDQTDQMTGDIGVELQKHKNLLAGSVREILKLRKQVAHCAVTIQETILSQDIQESEVKGLRARVAELEVIIAQSDEQASAAAGVFEAMQGAFGRMQETIKKVSERAKKTAADVELLEQVSELEAVAGSTLDDDSVAAYSRQIEALKSKMLTK